MVSCGRLDFPVEDQNAFVAGCFAGWLERDEVVIVSDYGEGVLESYVRRRLPFWVEPSAGRACSRKLVHLTNQRVDSSY